jgi:hypothetical protein
MARINKADHAIILRKVEVEECKISDVAAEYSCSAANLYALLRKLRRAGVQPAPSEPEDEALPAAPVLAAAADKPVVDLFASTAPKSVPTPAPRPAAPILRPIQAVPARANDDITPMPKGGGRSGVGASLAKPGYALAMRGPEGDENLTPFRSLDDLLSAVKPILRAAARNPEAIWFSIQPIDLATLDSVA